MKYPFYISCKKATYLISKQQEKQLTAQEKIQLFIHLLICNVCKQFKKQITLLIKLIERKQKNDYVLTNEARNRIKIKIDQTINASK